MPQPQSFRPGDERTARVPEIIPEKPGYKQVKINDEKFKLDKGIMEKLSPQEKRELIEYLKKDLEEKDN